MSNPHLFATILIPVFLLLSALLSAAETAFTTASKGRMLALEQEGNRRAALVNQLWRQKDLLISALLVGYNIINVIASSMTTAVMVAAFGASGLVYATAMMAVVIVLFVEILPKTLAIRMADSTALWLAPFVYAVVAILLPLTALCRGITTLLLAAWPTQDNHAEREKVAEQELRGAIDLHAGVFDQGQHTAGMLRAVVDLTDMVVADVMTHRRDIISTALTLPIENLVQTLLDARHTYVPLWKNSPEDIVGVIDSRQLLAALVRHQGSARELDIHSIISKPWFIPDSTALLEQLTAFRARKIGIAFVVDEYGVLQGMVTLADILEEIVGHYDRGKYNALAVPKALADGSLIMDGRFPLRELNREMGWDLDADVATTLAGYVIHAAERIPEPGDTIVKGGFSFDVLARKQKQLARIRIRKT